MRIGIFGGTFDPPHIGHLILTDEARFQLNLDQVWWLLTPIPPHKLSLDITPVTDRLEMVEAALIDQDRFEISYVDINRSPPYYALDTMRILRDQYPYFQFIYLIGGDSLKYLPTWHQPIEFIRTCDEIGVMSRPGYDVDITELEQVLPGLAERIRIIHTPLIEISSSRIRQRIENGLPFRNFLPAEVYRTILAKGLYSSSSQLNE